jgi:hypothetical protein
MAIPTFHITISGSMVGLYAAVVSTITGTVQLWNFFRDRARIEITVRHNMRIVDGDARYDDKTLTIVYVTNLGRRPVTINSVGAALLHPHPHIIIPNCNPPLPHELTEGKSLIAILPSCDLDFSTIDFWQAGDAMGRTYNLQIASRFAHILSNVRVRREGRRKRRETAKRLKAAKHA